MPSLRRYWFRFKNPPTFSPLGLGCGVTAFNYVEAMQILTAMVFSKSGVLEIDETIEDVDVRNLEGNHVLPNVGNVAIKGVWFPLGY